MPQQVVAKTLLSALQVSSFFRREIRALVLEEYYFPCGISIYHSAINSSPSNFKNVERLGSFRLQVNNLLFWPGGSRAGAFPHLQWGKCVMHAFAYHLSFLNFLIQLVNYVKKSSKFLVLKLIVFIFF